MLSGNFEDTLVAYIQDEDIENANKTLMTELATILVRDKQEFVDMLNEAGVEADNQMSNRQLIELFIDNTHNKKLLVGASLLTQIHNKKLGFDGVMYVSDDGVKGGVAVMDAYFNDVIPDEEYSYIAPALIGPLIQGASALLKNKLSKRDRQKVGAGYQALAERQMRERAALQQKLELERRQRALDKKQAKRQMNTILIVGGCILSVVIIGVIMYKRNRQ